MHKELTPSGALATSVHYRSPCLHTVTIYAVSTFQDHVEVIFHRKTQLDLTTVQDMLHHHFSNNISDVLICQTLEFPHQEANEVELLS